MAMSSSILDHKTFGSETFCLEISNFPLHTFVRLHFSRNYDIVCFEKIKSVIFLPFKTADINVFLTCLI